MSTWCQSSPMVKSSISTFWPNWVFYTDVATDTPDGFRPFVYKKLIEQIFYYKLLPVRSIFKGINAEGFDAILATPERVLVSQHRPDAEGLISILKCLKAKSYVLSLPGSVLVSYQAPLHSEREKMHSMQNRQRNRNPSLFGVFGGSRVGGASFRKETLASLRLRSTECSRFSYLTRECKNSGGIMPLRMLCMESQGHCLDLLFTCLILKRL
jgi:hypothetical protein